MLLADSVGTIGGVKYAQPDPYFIVYGGFAPDYTGGFGLDYRHNSQRAFNWVSLAGNAQSYKYSDLLGHANGDSWGSLPALVWYCSFMGMDNTRGFWQK